MASYAGGDLSSSGSESDEEYNGSGDNLNFTKSSASDYRKRNYDYKDEAPVVKKIKKADAKNTFLAGADKRSGYNDPSGPTTTASSSNKKTVSNQLTMEEMQKLGNYSSFSSKLMSKMGYKPGTGLGKEQQGRVDIIPTSNQRARRGLGLSIKALNEDVVVNWEDAKPPSAMEVIEWIPEYSSPLPDLEELEEWELVGKKKLTIDDEITFCDEKILQTMLTCKSVFDDLEGQEMRNARTRSNPYESIGGVIFLNRAAMKMANMDHCFDYMFTKPEGLHPDHLLYFADICAGPGGFSEYVLWRKKWRAKGFGFTLKGQNDFKLEKFFAASPEQFEPHYGVGGKDGDGDIMKSANIEEFQQFVFETTNDEGVHFVMADGGFSVEGQENIQEILTKQLLLCQFACALSIVRKGGHFVCKTFDLFTPFSIGLIYLLRIAFKRICIFKPVTSRPANSERYVVCEEYRDADRIVYQYLIGVNDTMNELRNSGGAAEDVNGVVPLEELINDSSFFEYMKRSNECIAEEQSKALAKLHAYAKDRGLMETRQTEIREECLKKWGIPDQVRKAPARCDAASLFDNLTGLDDPTRLIGFEPEYLKRENLQMLERPYNLRCYVSGSRSSILISLGGGNVFRWNSYSKRWSHVNQVRLQIPRGTILEAEVVTELKGEGKGQHRVTSLHVVDALVLAGENVMGRNYNERAQNASVFIKAITRTTYSHLNTVRMKDLVRVEEIQTIFDKLSLKRVKGGGGNPRVCYDISDTNLCFVPSGLCFIKFIKDPWSIAFSKSQKRKYFYNCSTRQSIFECPPDANASYELTARSRIFWKWEEKVKIHADQEHHRADLVSSDCLLEFVRSRTFQ